ncbi:MAG: class I SAM-dependent RNA methyltransferase [Gemmatimonadales bacterium]
MNDAVAITGIAAGGDGVGRLADGRAVFVPRTAPGDTVRVRTGTLKMHRHFARAEPGAILTVGPARVDPPCPHYVRDHCGGCQLQHLAYDAQLAAKRAMVGDALRRIGKLDRADPEIVEAVQEWRYRAQLTLEVKAGGPSASGLPAIGLHPYDRPSFVFPLADCHITDLHLMAVWRAVRARMALLPAGLTRLTLRLDREGLPPPRQHLIAEAPGDGWPAAGELRRALESQGDIVCWWQPVGGTARIVAPTTGAAAAFEPVNPEMDAVARRWAVTQLGEVRGRTIWDLYGGRGATAALLVERGASVVSVDADEQAIAGARAHVADARFIAARVEDILPTLAPPPPDAVLVSPPRAGLHWNVILRLTAEPVTRVVYVADDPATLARDLQRLQVNYEVTAVRAFDLFPQTARVTTVAVLEAA